jgi:hypothetical protein
MLYVWGQVRFETKSFKMICNFVIEKEISIDKVLYSIGFSYFYRRKKISLHWLVFWEEIRTKFGNNFETLIYNFVTNKER